MLFSTTLFADCAREDHALPVAVDHVAGHVGALRVREQLHSAVGVVVDPVVGDARPVRGLHVDAVVVVRRRQLAAVVDAVALDHGAAGAAVRRRFRGRSRSSCGAFVTSLSRNATPSPLTVGLGRLSPLRPSRFSPWNTDVVRLVGDLDAADDRRALARVAGDRGRRAPAASLGDLHVTLEDPGAQAPGLARRQRVREVLDRRVRLPRWCRGTRPIRAATRPCRMPRPRPALLPLPRLRLRPLPCTSQFAS